MNSGLYDVPGCSATCSAAARASWLALPATKLSKLNSEMRLERSACCARAGTVPAARAAGAGGFAGSEAPGDSRVIDTRIGEEKNSAPIASMRGAKRSLTHCRTKRLGASSRNSPEGAAEASSLSGRIQVLTAEREALFRSDSGTRPRNPAWTLMRLRSGKLSHRFYSFPRELSTARRSLIL